MVGSGKRPLGINVYDVAKKRISWVFDNFEKIYISFSGGKDSTVMTYLVMDEAIKRNRRVGLLFIDLEGQYKLTIDHIVYIYNLYKEHIEPFWVALPIHLRNAVSMYEPHWICWELNREEDWIRKPPKLAITDQKYFPFYNYSMEFEEFVPAFGHWYAENDTKLTACFVGIRSDESLNRYRTIASNKKTYFQDKKYTTWCNGTVYNVYPIYDWQTKDIWTYHYKTKKPYNHLYDLMHKAGLSIHQMRICQPYGDDQRKGLWLFHVLEPETWNRIVARVNGANSGALYAKETSNILGNIKISKPEGHTWESFATLLINSMPIKTKEHYANKIAIFIKWWEDRGFPNGIPDQAESVLEASRKVPSWRRICKSLLRNDYWCKGLSFSQTKSTSYQNYIKIMKRRRQEWGLRWTWLQ